MNGLKKLNDLLFPGAKTYQRVGAGKAVALGFQHAFAMSCATILVPLLTGLDVGVALLAAGLGTLVFHLCTGGKSPVFLGSSFAFIAALCVVLDPAGAPTAEHRDHETAQQASAARAIATGVYVFQTRLSP